MAVDVQLSAAAIVDQLARIEQAQKRLGMVNHGYGVRLAIAEVQRMAREALQTPASVASTGSQCPGDVPVALTRL